MVLCKFCHLSKVIIINRKHNDNNNNNIIMIKIVIILLFAVVLLVLFLLLLLLRRVLVCLCSRRVGTRRVIEYGPFCPLTDSCYAPLTTTTACSTTMFRRSLHEVPHQTFLHHHKVYTNMWKFHANQINTNGKKCMKRGKKIFRSQYLKIFTSNIFTKLEKKSVRLLLGIT